MVLSNCGKKKKAPALTPAEAPRSTSKNDGAPKNTPLKPSKKSKKRGSKQENLKPCQKCQAPKPSEMPKLEGVRPPPGLTISQLKNSDKEQHDLIDEKDGGVIFRKVEDTQKTQAEVSLEFDRFSFFFIYFLFWEVFCYKSF